MEDRVAVWGSLRERWGCSAGAGAAAHALKREHDAFDCMCCGAAESDADAAVFGGA